MFAAFIAMLLSMCGYSGEYKSHYEHAVFYDEAQLEAEWRACGCQSEYDYDRFKQEYLQALQTAKAGGIGDDLGA